VRDARLALDLPLDKIAGYCRRYLVRELSFVGSVPCDDFRPASDVDLLVEFLPEARPTISALERTDEEFESLVSRRIGLVPKRGLNPHLREAVLASARVR